MKIGIIGYGKMGKDIFSLFFDKIPDAQFVVIVRSAAQEHTDSVMKTLARKFPKNSMPSRRTHSCFQRIYLL